MGRPLVLTMRTVAATPQRLPGEQAVLRPRAPDMPESPPASGRRVESIDLMRGTLMALIVVGHAMSNLATGAVGSRVVAEPLRLVFRLGTPGFVMISGLLLGYFAVVRPQLDGILSKYRQRAFQLLVVAHLLIAGALYLPIAGPDVSFTAFAATRFYVTDSLALIFLLIAPLVPRLSAPRRAWVGAGLLVVATVIMAGLPVSWPPLATLKEILVGSWRDGSLLLDFYPLAPLTGMFLIGTYLGDRYGTRLQADDATGFLRESWRLVPMLLALTTAMILTWAIVRSGWLGEHPILQDVLYPSRRFSLFGAYLAAFLMLFGGWVWLSDVRGIHRHPLRGPLLALGRTSLFTYVAQYVVVQTFPWAMGWQGVLRLPEVALLCLGSFPVLFVAAVAWQPRLYRELRWPDSNRVRLPRRAPVGS